MDERTKQNSKSAQLLLVVLLALAIVGLITYSLARRTVKGMKSQKQVQLSYAADSISSGGIDKAFEFVRNDSLSSECDSTAGTSYPYTCSLSVLGLTDNNNDCSGNVTVYEKNKLEEINIKKDGVIGLDVDGFSGDLLVDAQGTGTLVFKVIDYDSEYVVESETMVTGTGSYNVTVSGNDPKVVRIRSLEDNMVVSVEGGDDLPVQQLVYVSDIICGTGEYAVTSKEVRIEWVNPGVPPVLDFVLYNGDGELKQHD